MTTASDVRISVYVHPGSARSTGAIAAGRRLAALLEPFGGRCEIVDVNTDPERARADHVLVTPTLVRRDRHPSLRIVGDVSDLRRLLDRLDIGVSADGTPEITGRRLGGADWD